MWWISEDAQEVGTAVTTELPQQRTADTESGPACSLPSPLAGGAASGVSTQDGTAGDTAGQQH